MSAAPAVACNADPQACGAATIVVLIALLALIVYWAFLWTARRLRKAFT